ncbi:response regulator [Thiothrix nivea]|uniref:Two component transcriptional regulator, LuxR family n=1 Tax=Thiothrix nivea (strain ATCC 35100 / DSM 5205 / JP2) TaxID=870187 RepID=A0A656HPE1_THINJ|nr:response regulator transcription factor [Thiothrix nivea]EIJ36915.1 two component transcriptional regulator, LuxR family [Thiothrix nivea DSM 5205]
MPRKPKLSTIMIVEDDPAVLKRLSQTVTESRHLMLRAACSTFSSAVKILELDPPDVLLVDLDLPDGNGMNLIRKIREEALDTQPLVISVFGDEGHVLEAIANGAFGYLHKDDDSFKIEDAIVMLVDGGSPITPSLARHVLRRFQPQSDAYEMLEKLTRRERDILTKVAKGYTSKEIAEMEELSYHTIATHVKNVYRKLSVNSKAEAIFEARRMNLI